MNSEREVRLLFQYGLCLKHYTIRSLKDDGRLRNRICETEYGNEVETSFVDTTDSLHASARGFARVARKFDAARRETEERYFDA
ncbi:MAG: hypothetical protein ISS15_00130 [Alphaproteobacteria bacterium]|nr:hypothetical protein [Alphaproteobacteria bacterium]MBL6937401.1 hypothetical protein [Alphaproteobacteria bacterium]MBL7096037.1 hypothetical protein [Alphaproteobacteria bacterium]